MLSASILVRVTLDGMPQTRPLPDTHPEFTVHRWPGFTEYRVEHWRLARDGSRRVVRGTCVWSWVDVGVLGVVVGILARFEGRGCPIHCPISRSVLVIGLGIVLVWLIWTRCAQVLHESLLVFPTLGIQLETHRGHPLLPHPISTTRHFIPLQALEDVVIHEGFRRWDVRYYLAALQRRTAAGASVVEVRVAFENVLPYFPILKVVYLGVQEALFPPPTRIVETDG